MNWFTRLLGFGPRPINNCTPRVQQALVLARKCADEHFHLYVDTEHILMGMLALGEGVGLCALQRQGVDLDRLKKEIEFRMSKGEKSDHTATIPYKPSVIKVLRKFGDPEARKLGHDYLGTEHVLLGILRLERGIAYESLKKQFVEIEASRAAIIECLKSALTKQKHNTFLS